MFQELEPNAQSTPSRAKVDPYSSGDEYLFDIKSSFSRNPAPNVGDAGATPHPRRRIDLKAMGKKLPSSLKKDLEDFGKNLEQEYCLFGTVPVKNAAAIITVIDLIVVFQLDDYFFRNRHEYFNYSVTMALTVALLGFIFFAQTGLCTRRTWMMLPLIMVHMSFTMCWIVLTAVRDLKGVIDDEMPVGRLGILFIRHGMIAMFNVYLIYVLLCAYVNLGDSKRLLKLSIVNALFEKAMEDEVLYEKKPEPEPKAVQKDDGLRTVRFLEPTNK